MVDVNRLRGELVAKGYTQAEIAEKLGITSKTFAIRLKQKRFYTDEIDKMIEELDLNYDDAARIFFTQKVTG